MNKKNAYIRIMLLLLCIITTPSFYLFSSYKAPGTRGRGYTGPKRIRQKPRTSIAPAEPTQIPTIAPTPIAAPTNTAQIAHQQTEEPQTQQPTVASQSMAAKAQAAASSPGWLMTAYMVFLSTLNKSLGLGIEQTYKPLLQKFTLSQALKNIQNEAREKVESGEFDQDAKAQINRLREQEISPENPQYDATMKKRDQLLKNLSQMISLPNKEKIALLVEEQEPRAAQIEKQTSFGAMAKDAAYLGLFSTATRVIGGLIGFGATMLLQSLVPTQSE